MPDQSAVHFASVNSYHPYNTQAIFNVQIEPNSEVVQSQNISNTSPVKVPLTNPESVEESEVASRVASNAKNLSGDKKSRQSMKKEKRSLQAVEMKVATFSDERLCKA